MTCLSCRNFRRGVAAQMGYCALDRTRAVLSGEEIQACWQAPAILEPAEGLFESLNTLLAPKPMASLALAGSGGQSVGSVPPAGRRKRRKAEPRGGARPRDVEPLPAPSAREGRLIEAPLVRPSRRIMSAADRMAMEGVRAAAGSASRPDSANLELDGAPQDGAIR
jgi:hypothetical protein